MGEQQAGGDGHADATPDHEELAVEPLEHRLAPRDAQRRHDRHHGAGVDHEEDDGAGQRRADLGVPRRRVLPVQQREHECAQCDRGHHPADVEGRPCHGAASDTQRNDHGDGEHEHREGGRHEQDEQHEKGLVDVDGVGTLGDVAVMGQMKPAAMRTQKAATNAMTVAVGARAESVCRSATVAASRPATAHMAATARVDGPRRMAAAGRIPSAVTPAPTARSRTPLRTSPSIPPPHAPS